MVNPSLWWRWNETSFYCRRTHRFSSFYWLQLYMNRPHIQEASYFHYSRAFEWRLIKIIKFSVLFPLIYCRETALRSVIRSSSCSSFTVCSRSNCIKTVHHSRLNSPPRSTLYCLHKKPTAALRLRCQPPLFIEGKWKTELENMVQERDAHKYSQQ